MSMRNLRLPSNLPSNLAVVQLLDVTDQLPKNPKNTWAQLAGVRSPEELTTIALHHDAWPKKNRADVDDIHFASEIATEHIRNTSYDPTGEGGFPYHIWVRNGIAYQTNDITDRTYGVGSNNGYTVHVCVSGDYTRYDQLTDADRNALYAAILAVREALPNCADIKPHKAFPGNNTSCPGYDHVRVINDVKTIEIKMQQGSTWEAQMKAVSKYCNEINYLTEKLKAGPTDGNAQWAMYNLQQQIASFRAAGLL